MALLSFGNSKLKRTEKSRNAIIGVFSLPAGQTCPRAGACAGWCYAKFGTYRFPSVVNHCAENLKAINDSTFLDKMETELIALEKKSAKTGKKAYVRIHDTGDFFDVVYIRNWITLMEKHPSIEFYAYTKSHVVLNRMLRNRASILANFTMLCSQGGLDDDKIVGPRIVVVPEGTTELPNGYEFGDMNDDLHSVDCIKAGKSVALVAHGAAKKRVA